MRHYLAILSGIILCAGATALAFWLHQLVPLASTTLCAILLGIILANTLGVPGWAHRGVGWTARHILRAGIVLLGLQVVIGDVLALGVGQLLTVCVVVAGGVVGTFILGRWLGIERNLVALIACGFSICGAAAIAGAQGVVRATKAQSAAALALVVAFGTAAIPLLPALGHLLGLDPVIIGAWAGSSIHEVAQVVAAAGMVGDADSSVMTAAVITKLARVLLLAVVVPLVGLYLRRDHPEASAQQLVPGFVLGFIALAAVSSVDHAIHLIPTAVYDLTDMAQKIFLAMAMFALGCGVRVAELRAVGGRPVILGAATTVLVTIIGGVGTVMSH